MTCKDGRFNTGNKICSNKPQDLHDNSMIVDAYVNSRDKYVEDRFGVERMTIFGIESNVEDRIGGIIADAGGVEIVGQWGSSENKVLNQKFITENSSRIYNSRGVKNINEMQEEVGNIFVINGENNQNRYLPNIYINGTMKSDGFDYVPFLSECMLNNESRCSYFGGQLRSLKSDLVNPLVQKMNINFIGDSNTWGLGTGQNLPTTPRAASMSDARDGFYSNSWVNIVKREIGRIYFNNENPELSNHESSPSGQSIAKYYKQEKIFPYPSQGFDITEATIQGVLFEERVGTELDYRMIFRGNTGAEQWTSLEFFFTGDSFDIYFTKFSTCRELKISVGSNVYYVNGYSESGTSLKQKQTIKFPFVKNKKVKFEIVNRLDDKSFVFYLEAIGINREVSIINNGIIGQSSASYYHKILDSAISKEDKYCFVMFGGNDRGAPSMRGARSISQFYNNMTEICKKLKNNDINPILMSTSDGVNQDNHIFKRQDAANATINIAKYNNVDMIDNFAVLNGTNYDSYTSDGTHLSIYGCAIVARNIVNAITSA